ncbi:DNA polymerase epsilon subunit 4 [Stomoxys calcitrans]|uniref:Transcription factor CBF/NF-Y/archaeal histone domain-containing protein n=1 Tax=Stomoxys calcitrans TaxID=35570 RepID=A0A1I8Q1I9_STOCA|nr:DNA polymerase epsilon subunit 4 [Stomoxys calcitrans]
MASEDLFAEDFSEEIISELEQDYVVEEADANDHEDLPIEESADDAAPTEEDMANTEETQSNISKSTTVAAAAAASNEEKLFQLPLTRVRNIMKLDPDLHIASNEAVFLVTRATELFIRSLGVESYTFTAQAKKKTIQKRDVDLAISAVDSLMFLDGAMTF